jgi:hypothetical protein
MSEGEYEGLAAGEKWGCGAALLVGIPVLLFLIALDALGDCAPDSGCTHGLWTHALLPSVVVAALVFFGVRWAVGRLRR